MFGFLKKNKDNNLYAPVTGEMIAIENVPDQMFAEKMMGDGVGFKFDGNTVYSPCDGEITMIANTLHAVGIKAANGAEILIHIGLDTVQLNGQGFKVITKAGSKVKKGTPIIEVDQEFMKKNNINLTTPMVITNSDEFSYDIKMDSSNVVSGDTMIVEFK